MEGGDKPFRLFQARVMLKLVSVGHKPLTAVMPYTLQLKLWKLSFCRANHNGVTIDQGSSFEMLLQSIAKYVEPAQD